MQEKNVNWNDIPDQTSAFAQGMSQAVIANVEETASASGKLMYVLTFQGVAPEASMGAIKKEYYVAGSDEDPLANNPATIVASIGMRRMKTTLNAAQVPLTHSIVQTLNSAKGAHLMLRIVHKQEEYVDKESGEKKQFVRDNISGFFKIGERAPSSEHCAIPICPMCSGGGSSAATTASTPATGSAALLPGLPPAPGVGALPGAPPVASAGPPTVVPPTVTAAPGIANVPQTQQASAVNAVLDQHMPAAPPVAPPVAPVVQAPVAPVIPTATPVIQAPTGITCPICKGVVAQADFPAHVQVCSQAQANAAVAAAVA